MVASPFHATEISGRGGTGPSSGMRESAMARASRASVW